ncbi:hypothetical protein ASG57_27245 [Bradyrhizobium sp. Leaf396]|nr:hypothetical protein ASG57_27245 [Bradyrhizobium sp. Leaf396]
MREKLGGADVHASLLVAQSDDRSDASRSHCRQRESLDRAYLDRTRLMNCPSCAGADNERQQCSRDRADTTVQARLHQMVQSEPMWHGLACNAAIAPMQLGA